MNTSFMTYKEENEQLRARVLELEEEAAWVRRKLKLPEDSKLLSGDPTLAGTLHSLVSHANGYLKYIETGKCDDKGGEIARQSVRIAELEKERDAAREEVEATRCDLNMVLRESARLREENAAAQLVIQQMREALQILDHTSNVSCGKVQEALALQPSTEKRMAQGEKG